MKYKFKRPIVKSIEETLNRVIREKCSMSRFWDGEIFILLDMEALDFNIIIKS